MIEVLCLALYHLEHFVKVPFFVVDEIVDVVVCISDIYKTLSVDDERDGALAGIRHIRNEDVSLVAELIEVVRFFVVVIGVPCDIRKRRRVVKDLIYHESREIVIAFQEVQIHVVVAVQDLVLHVLEALAVAPPVEVLGAGESAFEIVLDPEVASVRRLFHDGALFGLVNVEIVCPALPDISVMIRRNDEFFAVKNRPVRYAAPFVFRAVAVIVFFSFAARAGDRNGRDHNDGENKSDYSFNLHI